jgi:hypothetical protein
VITGAEQDYITQRERHNGALGEVTMDIAKVQKLVSQDEWDMSPAMRQRIMDNKMTFRDISFMEKTIMSMRMYQLRNDMEMLVPTFQEAAMRLLELKNQGEKEVDLDYALNLVNDMASWFMDVKELVDDFGLTEVEPAKDEPF